MIGPPPVRHVEHVMGMPISVALRGRHAADEHGRAAWAAVLAELRAADLIFSTYRPDSVISRLGRGELALADCPPEVAEVLQIGEAARVASGGAFDVRAGGRLDPSGVVKGWAAERAAAALNALPDTDFCLSAGGDVLCRTLHPHDPPWRIGLEDPHDPAQVLAVVPIHTGAVATSGSARRGAHILDARTGRPADALASVTVIGDSLISADLAATTAFALGPDGFGWLEERGWRAIVVEGGGGVRVSGGG